MTPFSKLILKLKAKKVKRVIDGIIPVSPFIIFTIIQLFNHEFNISIPTEKFGNYDSLFQPLVISIQIAIGLMGIVTMFYLGKIHDYRREFFKHEVDFYFEIHNVKKILKPLLDMKEGEPLAKLLAKLPETQAHIRNTYLKLPEKILHIALSTILYYGYALFVLVYFKETSSLTGFISAAVAFGTGIVFFVMEWLLFEEIISGFNLSFRVILSYLRFFKQLSDKKENSTESIIEDFEYCVKFLESQVSEEQSDSSRKEPEVDKKSKN